jgi:hypothetical protein
MDRLQVFSGAIPLETDILNTNRNAYIGLSKLASAVLGVNTQVNGFAVTPTAVPSLAVNVAAGEIYSYQNLDNTAYSSLPADTTHQILKQGIALNSVTLSITPPTTAGFSQVYLVQVTFVESDTSPVTLQYYNSANPSVPFSGPANNGLPSNTLRQNTAVVSLVAGTPAATGTQTAPAATAGVGVAIVTVANGATTITAANIAQIVSAPTITGQGNLRPAIVSFTASGSLTAAQTGSLVELNAASAATVTLPTPVGIAGQGYQIANIGAGVWTLSTPAGAFAGSGLNTASLSLATLQTAYVVSDGNNWIVLQLSLGASSIAPSGYQKFPSGLIIQWGSYASSGTAAPNVTVTLPIAFPNGSLIAYTTVNGATPGNFTVQVSGATATTATFTAQNNGVIASGIGGSYLVIGK